MPDFPAPPAKTGIPAGGPTVAAPSPDPDPDPGPVLAGIALYPIKGLDGVAVAAGRVDEPGGLQHDRRWKIVAPPGDPATYGGGDGADDAALTALPALNGKREPRVYRLRAAFDLAAPSARLWVEGRPGDAAEFDLRAGERAPLERWLSDYFGRPVRVAERPAGGFPDDPSRPGPTLISEATLAAVGAWFPALDPAETARRFRANLVIGGVPAFWEDGLYAGDECHGGALLGIGGATLMAVNPCRRCLVPTRDTRTGEAWPEFAAEFAARRAATLPAWTPPARFAATAFRLAVNTRLVPGGAGVAALGDAVTVDRRALDARF